MVEFPDGAEMEYSANTIAEAMFTQYDLEGNQHLLMDSIVDFKRDEQVVQIVYNDFVIKGRKY